MQRVSATSRPSALHPPKILRGGQIAGLVKLHRSDGLPYERQVMAGSAGRRLPSTALGAHGDRSTKPTSDLLTFK